ncbi:adenosylcobinamide-GDP ribazoletransferase [Allostella sp. ATCC 35155]|nr:adenosylcobinamide-GDP ribazoletransferase [Stella sp. ATCC 35155]
MSPAPHDDFRPAAWFADLRRAGQLLTRLPLPGDVGAPPPGSYARAMRAYPLVGGLIGLAAGLTLSACAAIGLPAPTGPILALVVAALLTGGLHEDGLADTADGFGARRPTAERLAIMRDSRIGTYGVLALVFVLSLKVAAMTSLVPVAGCAALVAAGALSRATLAGIVRALPPARPGGLGASLGHPSAASALLSLLLGVAVALAAVGPSAAARIALVAVIAAVAMALLARRQVGGYTGDVLGATQQVTETAMLVALSADPVAIAHWIGRS